MADPVESPPSLPVADNRLKPCAGCRRPLAQAGPTFWLVAPARACLDIAGIRERVGLATMFGVAEGIAAVFASKRLAATFDHLPEICVCEDCAARLPLAELALRSQS